METVVPRRRPFLGKIRTSILKRREGVARRLGRVFGRGPVTRRYFGARFELRPGELISDEIAINRFEWRELTMMLAACREFRPEVFVDVGANVGLYSCIVGRAGAARGIVAFEPDAGNFDRLLGNLRLNGLTEAVEARPVAVGARVGVAVLAGGPPENSGLSRIDPDATNGREVPVVALDDVVTTSGGVIAVKIDVEGHELDVLAGSAHLFRNNRGYAQIEAHGDERAAEVTAIMKSYGWHLIERYGLDMHFERRP